MITAEVLGIEVDQHLVEQWRGWFAPPVQPFRVDALPARVAAGIPMNSADPTPEWRDTFFMYGGAWTWLDEDEFTALQPGQRRSLLAARRRAVRPKPMPVWPSDLARAGDGVMFDWIATPVRPSRHQEVPDATWNRVAPSLPGARRLAGTFPASGSGPNCFGAVMAAAGVTAANDTQIRPPDFQAWLDERAQPITGAEHDDEPGIVFTWNEHGRLAHATVTVGDGWMLSKPSQSWSSPSLVWTVREAVNSWRFPGTRLSRHRILR